MGKYDTLGNCEESRDLYYVNTPPNSSKKKSLSRWDIENFEQEQLERQFYVRLQGHRGKILPALGQLCKIIFLTLLFPFYCLVFIKRKLEKAARSIYFKIMGILTPPALKVYHTYLKIRNFFLRIKSRIEKIIQSLIDKRNQCINWIKGKLLQLKAYAFDPIVHWGMEKKRQLINQLERIVVAIQRGFYNFLSRISSKISQSIKSRIGRMKTRMQYFKDVWHQEMVVASQQRIQKFNDQMLEKKLSVSQSFAKKMRSYVAWGRVLGRYGMRVAEDWTLEIKRWFSLQ